MNKYTIFLGKATVTFLVIWHNFEFDTIQYNSFHIYSVLRYQTDFHIINYQQLVKPHLCKISMIVTADFYRWGFHVERVPPYALSAYHSLFIVWMLWKKTPAAVYYIFGNINITEKFFDPRIRGCEGLYIRFPLNNFLYILFPWKKFLSIKQW